MLELHQSLHDSTGMCLWTILAIIVFCIIVVILAIHLIRQKARDDRFNNEMESLEANKSVKEE